MIYYQINYDNWQFMPNNSVTLEKHRYRQHTMSVDEERVRTLMASLKKEVWSILLLKYMEE